MYQTISKHVALKSEAHLSKDKWSIILLGQLSFPDGPHWGWSTTENPWQHHTHHTRFGHEHRIELSVASMHYLHCTISINHWCVGLVDKTKHVKLLEKVIKVLTDLCQMYHKYIIIILQNCAIQSQMSHFPTSNTIFRKFGRSCTEFSHVMRLRR